MGIPKHIKKEGIVMFESSELREVTTTCMDILPSEIAASYGHLPEDKIYEWATYQSALSVRYMTTDIIHSTVQGITKPRNTPSIPREE